MVEKKSKVLVGMSGGVDSSLSAALLLEQGYDVVGAFMKNWSGSTKISDDTEEFIECDWRSERRDAMRVAAQLGIPFFTFDFEKEYRERVVEYLFREYSAGRTPNPDVMCNKFMKFDLFVKEADKLGCEFVATGHYARRVSASEAKQSHEIARPAKPVGRASSPSASRKDTLLLAGVDPNKDQSYFLCQIPREVLPRVLFPVGSLLKSEVREAARAHGLVVAEKKDSQGVCFIGEINMTEFLKQRIPETLGNIIKTGTSPGDVPEILGQHRGLAFYTIGQREGLNVGGLETPYYVVEKRAETNELVVSSNFHEALYRNELIATEMNWLVPPSTIHYPLSCRARIRYRQPLEACAVQVLEGGRLHVTFNKPQRAVTPGQFIVFYDGDVVIGGAVIE